MLRLFDKVKRKANRMQINQAIILAGGRGERLRPFTYDRPKPMIEVFDHPILYYVLTWLKKWGFKKAVIACSYKYEVISEYFGNGKDIGLDISYSLEEKSLGRGGGIKLASYQLLDCNSPVLIINGDVITNLSLNDFCDFHNTKKAKITIVTVPLRSPYGIVEINDKDLAVQFREKPILDYWINAGIYLINKSMFAQFPDIGDHEEILFPSLAIQNDLHAYKFKGFWRTVDTGKDLEELKKEEETLCAWT
jgi:NDP-sugar pyrophosphorylase family protein